MQSELFQELQTAPATHRVHPALFPYRFLRMRVAYEDLIFIFLSLLLILLAGFCLGVERGKRLGVARAPVVAAAPRRVVAPPLTPTSVPDVPSLPRVELPVLSTTVKGAIPAVPDPKSVSKDSYVIQLASFLDEKSAQTEAKRLTRQGFRAQVVRQGRYFEVRVGRFRSKQEAGLSLATLKRTYRDGFIKRVESDRT